MTSLLKLITSLTTVLLLAACDPQVNPDLVSRSAAPSQSVHVAQRAIRICGQLSPDYPAMVRELARSGFAETDESVFFGNANPTERGRYFEDRAAGVLIVVGTTGAEVVCIVGLRGMTPEQSVRLAQPWVTTFGAQTNAERGQGLANNAAQAWADFNDERLVYIAAYRTWAPLGEPGAAVRLIYRNR